MIEKKIKLKIDSFQQDNGLFLLPEGLFKKTTENSKKSYKNLTDQAASYLFDQVVIHPDFTINNLFELILENYTVFSIIYRNDFIMEYVNYYKLIKEGKIRKNIDDRYPIHAVELYWFIHSQQGEDPFDKEKREEIEQKLYKLKTKKYKIVDTDGDSLDDLFFEMDQERKKEIKKELKDGTYYKKQKENYYLGVLSFPHCHLLREDEGKIKPFGMSFVGLEQMLEAKLVLSNVAQIIKEENSLKKQSKPLKFENPKYTLGQIIKGFLWEISFHGAPDDTNEVREEIDEKMSKIKDKS